MSKSHHMHWCCLFALAIPALAAGAPATPDAEILRWEQSWTLEADGTIRTREYQKVRINNSRPIRRFADPRIDFRAGIDKLTVHLARTVLPSGEELEVPDYSYNRAGPSQTAGWPTFSGWTQQVISFSGIEPGAVLELDYEIVSPPGHLPWLDLDVRLNDEYPIYERVVSITTPAGTELHHQLEPPPGASLQKRHDVQRNSSTIGWELLDVAAVRNEPQAVDAVRIGPRLRATTAPSAFEWTRKLLDEVQRAADPNEVMSKFAEEASKDEFRPAEKARKIAAKLAATFNSVSGDRLVRSTATRPSAVVFQENYGHDFDAGALWLAVLRAAGFEAQPRIVVDARTWREAVPTLSSVEGVVIAVDLPDGELYFHPKAGEVTNPGSFGQRILLDADRGELATTNLRSRGEEQVSELHLTVDIKVSKDAAVSGRVEGRLTGLFFDPQKLQESKAQQRLIGSLLGRVLEGFEVSKHSVQGLSGDDFRFEAEIASKEPLTRTGPLHVLRLGDGPALLADVPLPLDVSKRSGDVQLAGRARERVIWEISWPESWSPAVVPAAHERVTGSWGELEQGASVDGSKLRLERTVGLTQEVIPRDQFISPSRPGTGLREQMNSLRADRCLVLGLAP